TVSGIGPKGAMGILSIMTPDDIRFAVLSSDSAAIAKAPGVGKKTAEKLIIELKDKVDLSDGINLKTENVVTAASSAFSAIKNDAVMALVALGYSQSAAYAAVNVIDINDTMTDTDILKLALKNI
ncbi:MAG: Holliday junction branch migration protein RuvA, partial [Lachnospiraceae bacterium]|nr:Holliday junction branch migration protein RuvA [Lachnospiraceae bacterium]